MTTTAHPTEQRRSPDGPAAEDRAQSGPCYLTAKGFKPSPMTADRPEEN